jgi:hypothetical protein
MTYRKFYLFSILCIIVASVYPIYMGILAFSSYLQNGFIDAAHYPKYIIPYTPICISLILSTCCMPFLFKLFKRFTLFAASILGIVLFIIAEFGFEQIKVVEGYTALPLESWQYSLCIATPEVLKSIGEPIYAEDNPAYKIHFYIIAIVIILGVLKVIYDFSILFRDHYFKTTDQEGHLKAMNKLRPLFAQTISVILFISLCILACFTAFFRKGTLHISPLSALLMAVFFIVFGVTVGIYTGSVLIGRKKFLAKIIPSVLASFTTLIMYIGELILLGGKLFRFGESFLFQPLGAVPFSAVDLAIILLSGIFTYFIMKLLNRSSLL